MKKLNTVAIVLLLCVLGPSVVLAQSQSIAAPLLALCDPLLTAQNDDDEDEDELIQTRRYDQETAERLTTREQIMNALFEEKWNFVTEAVINRHELCSAEPNYVVLWTRVLQEAEDSGLEVGADGYMSIRKDGTFEFVFAKRPYRGTWELDGIDMVLTAEWLNDGKPYRKPAELVRTPVDTVDADGNENRFIEEMYRLGGFRFFRLPTTQKGGQRTCSCANFKN